MPSSTSAYRKGGKKAGREGRGMDCSSNPRVLASMLEPGELFGEGIADSGGVVAVIRKRDDADERD